MQTNIWQALVNLITDLAILLGQVFLFLLSWSLLLVWTAWWLGAVNWPRLWTNLKQGAWAPFVLLLLVAALVWSRLDQDAGHFLGVPMPHFWWQLCYVALLAGYTLFLGWLQGVFQWAPAEIDLEPPAHGHDAHHGHEAHHSPGGQHAAETSATPAHDSHSH